MAETTRSSNSAFQPRHFTTYERDGNASDEAMHRRYNRWHSRFDQADPYGGSYDMTNPQSFNRYGYVQNDPVNFVDPMGLCPEGTVAQPDALGDMQCVGVGGHSVTINISGGGRGVGPGGVTFGPMEIEGPPVQGPTGGDFPQTPAPGFDRDLGEPPNFNCISRAVIRGILGQLRGLIAGVGGMAAHDGMHIYAPLGPPALVTGVPAMAGRILHTGRQGTRMFPADYRLGLMDIQLSTRINGQIYVMTLKDMVYNSMQKSGDVRLGAIGYVEGSADTSGESGLHVTLMPKWVYDKYIGKSPSGPKRASVPFKYLMDAARDKDSPFRCP